MFDVGFSEMMVIAVVALIVIGPERLPKVARTLGHLWGRAQRYINGVKADISRDMALEELKQLREKVQQEADQVAATTRSVSLTLDQQVRGLNAEVTQAAQADSPKKIVPPEQQKLPIN